MALTKPEKPLKVLTLDGGGLQAISTLLILDNLLATVQRLNETVERPRPCDVFDVIAGIGAGGWLALLLGRFRLDVKTALTEWYKLIECIAPRSRAEGIRRRLFRHTYFDQDLLVNRVERLTALYGTGNTLLEPRPGKARCRYCFVAGRQADGIGEKEEYNLFRTYEAPEDEDLRPGPSNPKSYEIARAFGATGAARFFCSPWKEERGSEEQSFLDNAFPRPHNITLLALEELWTLFGADVPISVIVNIGPGFPTDADMSWIARRFSFKRNKPPPADINFYREHYLRKSDSAREMAQQNTASRPSAPTRDSRRSIAEIAYGPRNRKLRTEEAELESRIREQLRKRYDRAPPYYRLALDTAPQGTTQNDSREPGTILDVTAFYCESWECVVAVDEISRLVRLHSDNDDHPSTVGYETPATQSSQIIVASA